MAGPKRMPVAAEDAIGDDALAVANDYRLREQIGTILRIANQNAVDVFNRAIVGEFGESVVTTTQFAVLVTLWRNGPLSHSDLAERTVMDMPTLHSVLKRLDRKGLIATRTDSGDRRKRIVTLTTNRTRRTVNDQAGIYRQGA